MPGHFFLHLGYVGRPRVAVEQQGGVFISDGVCGVCVPSVLIIKIAKEEFIEIECH